MTSGSTGNGSARHLLETPGELFLPIFGRGKAAKRAHGRQRAVRELAVVEVVIDVEAAGLGRVPWRLGEDLDAVVFGIAEINRPGIGVRHRLRPRMRQVPDLFVNQAYLVETIDTEGTWPIPPPALLAAAPASAGIRTIWWCSPGLWLRKINSRPLAGPRSRTPRSLTMKP